MNIHSILSQSPVLEIIIRNLYWRFSGLHRLLSRLQLTQKKKSFITKAETDSDLLPNILNQLTSLGVKKGDLLLVHSSMSTLKNTGLSPKEICNALIDFIGPNGTLAMPAIPLFPEEPRGIARMGDQVCKRRLVYDVQESMPWTGVIPTSLMSFDNAVRSLHPLNTMVAVGPLAEPMMEFNIEGEYPKACGINSSWKFCADHNAKIVFLGADAAHSITLIHVVEDSYRDNGNAPGWYRERLFTVIDKIKGIQKDITVQERHPKWSMYYAERTLQRDLIKYGVLKVRNIGGVEVSFCEAKELINFLTVHKTKPYPFLVPLWKR